MRLGAQSAARSTNLAEPVVALLAALGTRIADVTETVTTDGPRARRLANVSRRLSHCRYTIAMSVFVFPSLGVLAFVHIHTHRQPRRPRVPYVPSAASSRNPGKAVAAVAVVLGSEAAVVLETPNIRGTRASRHAKRWRRPRQQQHQPSTEGQTRLKLT